MLRLADLAFLPYEVASFAGVVYQQTWLDEHGDEEDRYDERETMATVIGERPIAVSCEKLPSIWVDPRGD
jgi:hypothetical protein